MFIRLALLCLGSLALLTACPSVQTLSVASDPQILRGNWQGEFLERCRYDQSSPSWNVDGSSLFTYDYNSGSVNVWNPSSGTILRKFSFQEAEVMSGAVAGDKAVVQLRNSLKTYRVSDGKELSSIPLLPYNSTFGVVYDDALERALVARGITNRLELLELSSGKVLQTFPGNISGRLSPDGRRVALGFDDKIQVWDVGKSEPLLTVMSGPGSFIFTGGGNYLARATQEEVKVWRIVDGKQVLSVKKDMKDDITLLRFSGSKLGLSYNFRNAFDRYDIPAERNGSRFELYNLESGQKERSLELQQNSVAALSPEGTRLLAYRRSSCELDVLNVQGQTQTRLDLPRLESKPFRLEATAQFLNESEYAVGGKAFLDGQTYTVSGTVESGCDTRFRAQGADSDYCKNRGWLHSPSPMGGTLQFSGATKSFELGLSKYRDNAGYYGENTFGTDKSYTLLLTRANP